MRPKQKDLFSNRWRTVRAIEPDEAQIQKALIEHLEWRCRDGVVYFHVPNGGKRDIGTARQLKKMGVKPGVADLVFIWPTLATTPGLTKIPAVLFLELKRKNGRQTAAQLAFADACKKAGCYCAVADTIDGAIQILEHYRLLEAPHAKRNAVAVAP